MTYRCFDKGQRGPHPNVGRLPHYAIIIRAETMRGDAVRQALDELSRRGLWLSPNEKYADAERRMEMQP